ncbi:MAG: DUF1667 domain-containing protein [Lachnospiraceae bacterium]|nr:DUF1667 domain-containing protein [Lachnospiraceae bacterium]
METKNLTCIGCPMGCALTVTYEPGNRDSVKVTGNTCKKGELYAIDEVTNPTRIVTGTVRVSNRKNLVASVKTKDVIPKSKIFDVAHELMKISVEAPAKIGDVVVKDICGTGSDLIITRNVE